MGDTQGRTSGKRDLVSGSLLVNLMRLALPLAAGMVLNALYQVVDVFWLGRWSKEALGAPGVTMPFFFFVVSFGMGFGNAGTALVAQFTGAQRFREADRAAGQVFLLLVFLALVLATPLRLLADPVLSLFGVPENMMPQALVYFRIMLVGMPLTAFTMAYAAVLRALGDTMTAVLIGFFTNLLNAALDPFLIFGWGPFPTMGTGGAAIATVFSQFVGVLICVVLVRRGKAGLEVHAADLRPDWGILRKMFVVGFPTAVGNSSNSLGFLGFQSIINRFGETVIGAFTIGFRIIHIFNVPGQSLAMATAPVVGQALGAGQPRLARRAVATSAAIAAILTLVPTTFLMWKGQLVARLFIGDAAIIEETGKFFLIVPASSYFFGIVMVLMAAFYGSGYTWPAMVVAILRLWAVRIPVAWLLGFKLGLGSAGVYGGMVAGNVVSALLALVIFLRGRWQRTIVPVRKEAVEDPAAADDTAGTTTQAGARAG